jgi:hypothetical protein
MNNMAKAADCISYGDLVKDQVLKQQVSQRSEIGTKTNKQRISMDTHLSPHSVRSQDWSLLPFLGVISTVIPAAYTRGRSGAVNFPSALVRCCVACLGSSTSSCSHPLLFLTYLIILFVFVCDEDDSAALFLQCLMFLFGLFSFVCDKDDSSFLTCLMFLFALFSFVCDEDDSALSVPLV